MKKSNFILLLLCSAVLILSSCSESSSFANFSKRKYHKLASKQNVMEQPAVEPEPISYTSIETIPGLYALKEIPELDYEQKIEIEEVEIDLEQQPEVLIASNGSDKYLPLDFYMNRPSSTPESIKKKPNDTPNFKAMPLSFGATMVVVALLLIIAILGAKSRGTL